MVIRRIGELAYQLELPNSLRVYDVFHTSQLRPYYKGGRYQPPPPALLVDGEWEYEVDSILSMRNRGNKREFLVRWAGSGPESNSWEPESNLTNAREAVDLYLQGTQQATNT